MAAQCTQGAPRPTSKAWQGISAIAFRHFIWQLALPHKLNTPRQDPHTHRNLRSAEWRHKKVAPLPGASVSAPPGPPRTFSRPTLL